MNIINRIKDKLILIFKSHYTIAKVLSVKGYSQLFQSSIKYFLISKNRKTTVYPIQFFNDITKDSIETPLSDSYYAIINSCKIIGQSNVILTKNNYLLYDNIADNSCSNVNVTDGGLFLFLNRVIHIGKYNFINYKGDSKELINKGIMLSGNFSNNYFHFVFEFLVKFDFVNKANIDISIPIILDNHINEIPQFKELISIFNRDNREIIYVKPKIQYSINELHSFSFVNKIPANIKGKLSTIKSIDFAFDFNSIEFLRTTVKKQFDNTILETPRKIFISRGNCNKRKNNEFDFYPLLKKYGYAIIYPENLTLYEQFSYFANAEHIIAASGAALTNIIFCSTGCEILVFQSIKAEITIFSSIANYNKTNMIYIAGLNKTKKLHPDFVVSIDLFEKYLKIFDKESQTTTN